MDCASANTTAQIPGTTVDSAALGTRTALGGLRWCCQSNRSWQLHLAAQGVQLLGYRQMIWISSGARQIPLASAARTTITRIAAKSKDVLKRRVLRQGNLAQAEAANAGEQKLACGRASYFAMSTLAGHLETTGNRRRRRNACSSCAAVQQCPHSPAACPVCLAPRHRSLITARSESQCFPRAPSSACTTSLRAPTS